MLKAVISTLLVPASFGCFSCYCEEIALPKGVLTHLTCTHGYNSETEEDIDYLNKSGIRIERRGEPMDYSYVIALADGRIFQCSAVIML